MTKVLVCGAGKVGIATVAMFLQFPDYEIYLADQHFHDTNANEWLSRHPIRTIAIDVNQEGLLAAYCQENAIEVIVSTLLADMSDAIIATAIACQIHYVDCSPKVHTPNIELMAEIDESQAAFVPNCGLAPGWTGLIANHFMMQFDYNIHCQIQVGVIADEMTHSLSGSAKRFMLELTEQATIIDDGISQKIKPFADIHSVNIQEKLFESTYAANGYGHLPTLWQGKVKHLSYQTLMPQNMAHKIQFLVEALRLNEQPENLQQLLVPVFTRQSSDSLWIKIDCSGDKKGQTYQQQFVHVYEPFYMAGVLFSPLQMTTALGITSVVDMICQNPDRYQGLVAQETMDYNQWVANRFTRLLIGPDSFYQAKQKQPSQLNTTL